MIRLERENYSIEGASRWAVEFIRAERAKLRRLRKRGERGAALVESAIIILPLCVIIFGIIEFGFVFKDSLTLSSATRAGARTASAVPGEAAFMNEALQATTRAASAANFRNNDVLFVYRATDAGLPQSGNKDVCSIDCKRWRFHNGSWVEAGGAGWAPSSHKACLGGQIDSVGVSLRVTHKSITGFFPFINNMRLHEHTVMRLEPLKDNC